MKKYIIFVITVSLLLPIFSFATETSPKNGIYEVDVALWHAYEDKVSMGSQGMEKTADLLVEDGQMKIYLKMKTLSVGDLTTSVTRIFYANEESKSYRLAESHAYNIEIPNETLKRPEVFVVPLKEKKPLYSLLVDPKVPAMGVDPIKARLKVEWDTLSEKKSNEGPYYLTGNAESNHPIPKQLLQNNILIEEPAGISGDIKISSISRSVLEKNGLKVDILDQVKGFDIHGVQAVVEVPFDKTSDIDKNALAFSLTENATLLFQQEEDVTNVFHKKDAGFEEIPFEKTEGGILIRGAQFGTFALVKKPDKQVSFSSDDEKRADDATGNQKNEGSLQNSSSSIIKAEKPKPKAIVKPEESKPKNISSAKERSDENREVEDRAENRTRSSEGNNQNNNLYSDSNRENSTIYPATEEHKGIIGVIVIIYFSMLLIGLILWRKFLPLLMEEVDRSRYLEIYSVQSKGGEVR
ncbi:MAG: NEAT domain-containing protein [Peptostreptococcaceae bacterium]|nr:NEAT domain-containing protein [Peptostreptococcaceae bacterium]